MWTIVQFCFYASMLLRFLAILLWSKEIPVCFFASTLLQKWSPQKLPFASKLLRFYASTLLCFYASTNFPRKKSPSASTLLRFYASRKISPEKTLSASMLLCFYASTLLCFWKKIPRKNHPLLLRFFASMLLEKFPQKNHPLLLRFFASMLLEQFSLQKSGSATSLLRFYASWKFSPTN